MGLCKCPKRQVTTQFCFEHRVNVCENCMVVNHTKCTVQSYIQWLKDSDFDTNCTLCGSPRDSDDCVRLICYHVFHWKCLNARQQMLPPNTAPGGHTCPICSEPLFPPSNLVSPVADVLRVRLGQVNWGRNELGLPLIMDEKHPDALSNPSVELMANQRQMATGYSDVHGMAVTQNRVMGIGSNSTNHASSSSKERPETPHSVLNLDPYVNIANSRRTTLLAREPPIGGSDRDDNKYKRRTPKEIFSRWSRRLYAPSARPVWRKTWFLVATGLLGFVCIVYVMATISRGGEDEQSGGGVDRELGGFIPNRNLPHAEE
ncbi:zinc finger protein-like 1 homolog [Anopheles maculipalpis]|uniref:zinc finger protein-like 1 homolog n=1 Tax=Anopheles maculipalpis TaxID=1496333 RepID=UPI0021591874|nr:zinc finger protein-like 1 homolog [Anopheles maculipalpis]